MRFREFDISNSGDAFPINKKKDSGENLKKYCGQPSEPALRSASLQRAGPESEGLFPFKSWYFYLFFLQFCPWTLVHTGFNQYFGAICAILAGELQFGPWPALRFASRLPRQFAKVRVEVRL